MKSTSMVFLCGGLVAVSVKAATFTWDGGGGDNNWQTAGNWSGDAAPAGDGTATLVFSGNTRTAAANDFADAAVFAGLSFLNDSSADKTAGFTLSGNRITLGGNIVTTQPAVDSTITDTLSLPMLLNGTRAITVNLSGNKKHNLVISGAIGETGGSQGLTKSGNGYLTLTGANTYSGPTVMSGGLVYFNSIKNIGEGASSFGAPTTVENGTITNSSRLSYTGSSTTTDRPLVLTGGIQFDVSSSASTLTMNGDITSANNSGITFRGSGNFVINGMISVGASSAGRTDGGTVYLNCPTNPFTGNIGISAGAFSISNIADSGVACAIGKGSTITLGQHGWGTSGKLQFTGVSGGSCNRAIRIETTPGTTVYGGLIENTVAGQTLSLSGSVAPGSSSSTNQPRLQLIGAGNGELSGVVSGSIKIEKNSGTGTWIFSGANTYTGATAVSAGTLLINGSTHADSAVSVASGGTLGGTGTVYGAVSVSAGGTLAPGIGGIGTLTLASADSAALTLNGGTFAAELGTEAGACDRIDIGGELVLNGANTIALSVGSAPAGTYTLMTYASHSGDGTLALDTVDPIYRLTVGSTHVTLTIGSNTRVWKGDDSANAWDTTTANWLDGDTSSTYADGTAVLFNNTGSASPAISISPNAVAPFSVTVDADTNAYTIGGAAITGGCDLTKTGTNSLTLTGANTYSGATAVNAGTLALSGSLSNSSVTVANGATFTESADAVIAGADASFAAYGTSTLAGTNTYGGATIIGISGTAGIILTANNNSALGSPAEGTTVYGGNSGTENRLVLGKDVTVLNETLILNGGPNNRAGLHYAQYSGTGRWYGDITLDGGPCYVSCDNTGGTFEIGASSEHAVTGSSGSLSLRGLGILIINSTINIGTTGLQRDDYGTAILNAANNVFGNTTILEGRLKLGVDGAFPSDRILTLGKSGNTAHAIFDLNGKCQTIAGLADQRYSTGSGTQRILSDLPATLTVSNDTACSYGKTGSSIEGAVSLVKLGTSTLTLAGTNSYSGATVVSNGMLAVSATGMLGTNSLSVVVGGEGTLALSTGSAIADAATVQMPEKDVTTASIQLDTGVEENVGWLLYGDVFKKVGTYGAPGSGADYIDGTHFSGGGKLRVLHSKTGMLITVH